MQYRASAAGLCRRWGRGTRWLAVGRLFPAEGPPLVGPVGVVGQLGLVEGNRTEVYICQARQANRRFAEGRIVVCDHCDVT
jgi:hypothetical protein